MINSLSTYLDGIGGFLTVEIACPRRFHPKLAGLAASLTGSVFLAAECHCNTTVHRRYLFQYFNLHKGPTVLRSRPESRLPGLPTVRSSLRLATLPSAGQRIACALAQSHSPALSASCCAALLQASIQSNGPAHVMTGAGVRVQSQVLKRQPAVLPHLPMISTPTHQSSSCHHPRRAALIPRSHFVVEGVRGQLPHVCLIFPTPTDFLKLSWLV